MFFKVLTSDLKGPYSYFDFTKYVKSGAYLPQKKSLRMCKTGYHITDLYYLFRWTDYDPSKRIFLITPKNGAAQFDRNFHNSAQQKINVTSFKFIKELKNPITYKNRGGMTLTPFIKNFLKANEYNL